MIRMVAAFCILSVWHVQGAGAQRVDAWVDRDSVRVGERFLLMLRAVHAFDERPGFPDPAATGGTFGDLEVLSVAAEGHRVLGASARLDSIVFDVTTFSLDTAVVPPLPIVLHSGTRTDSTARLVVPVISIVPADADTIRGMAEAVPFLEPGRQMPPWPWVLLGLAVLLGFGALVWWVTRSRTQIIGEEDVSEPMRSPYEVALRRLRVLERTDLSVQKNAEPFYVELSEALRCYLEQRIAVPALEMATGEVLEALSQVRYKVPGRVPDEIASVLRLSDLVKFAEFLPRPRQGKEALGTTRRAIERLEQKQLQLAQDEARHEEGS